MSSGRLHCCLGILSSGQELVLVCCSVKHLFYTYFALVIVVAAASAAGLLRCLAHISCSRSQLWIRPAVCSNCRWLIFSHRICLLTPSLGSWVLELSRALCSWRRGTTFTPCHVNCLLTCFSCDLPPWTSCLGYQCQKSQSNRCYYCCHGSLRFRMLQLFLIGC